MFGIAHGDAMLFQARAASHAGFPTTATNEASSLFIDVLLTLHPGLHPTTASSAAVTGLPEL